MPHRRRRHRLDQPPPERHRRSVGRAGAGPAPAPACTAGQPIWNLVFDDQFSGDGAALGSSWSAYNSTSSGVHPRDGENNIHKMLEAPGDRHEFYSFITSPTAPCTTRTTRCTPPTPRSGTPWRWNGTPDKLVLYRDGVTVKTMNETSADLILDNPHFMAIQLDAWKSSVPAAVWMQLDCVKIWSYGGRTTC